LENEPDSFELRTPYTVHPLHYGLHTQNSRARSREFNWEKKFNYSLSTHKEV